MPSKRVNISQMKNGEGKLHEIYLNSSIRIDCPPELIPAPGQYLLAHARGSDSPLAVPVFFSDAAPNGFRCAPILDSSWLPGTQLDLRGPLGHGFAIPSFARKVALIAFDDSFERMRGLIPMALKQEAEVVLVCKDVVEDMSEAVEVQPLQALIDIYHWADFAAIDVARENLNQLREMLGKTEQAKVPREAQVLVRAPMPCGALAECGVCALAIKHDWKMICKEGPVFEMNSIL
jgi:Iron-sulfur cluster binding domain of dihydroorotate dehydrogenase B